MLSLNVGIDHRSSPKLARQGTACRDRFDRNDLGGAGDPCALNGAQAKRSTADDADIGAGGDRRYETQRAAQSARSRTSKHRQLNGGYVIEYRDAVLFCGNHQFGESTTIVLLGDRTAVRQRPDHRRLSEVSGIDAAVRPPP